MISNTRINFKLEKETKNTYRYQEVPDEGKPPVLGALYLQKWFTGETPNEKITVIITPNGKE
jgi:hypothetical protein